MASKQFRGPRHHTWMPRKLANGYVGFYVNELMPAQIGSTANSLQFALGARLHHDFLPSTAADRGMLPLQHDRTYGGCW